MTSEPIQPERFPPGLQNAFWFATFNAFSFQIVLSSPMFLYARQLDAGATVLGLIAGMMPLLVILQIFAAPYDARVGYKRFVYGGWSIRVMFIGLIFTPFQRLLWFAVSWSFAYGGVTVFIVAFLKHLGVFSEQQIMFITATTFLGTLSSLGMLGERLDRLGSKPVLMVAQLLGLLMLLGWTAVAGGVSRPSAVLVSLLTMIAGLSGAVVQMAKTRLVMAIAPKLGRSHFFALFSVVSNVSLGIAPMFWGLIIDLNRQTQVHFAGLEWNRFSLFFASAAAVMCFSMVFCRRLQEPQAAGMETLLKDVLIDSPHRLILRLLHRG